MAKKFTPRLTVPAWNNKYYIRKSAGGYSNAIAGYPEYYKGSVLANCVGYAVGRFNEIIGEKNCNYLPPVNAEEFIRYATAQGLEIGQTPKLGGVMVWQKGQQGGADGAGHVAVVEARKGPRGKEVVTTSESGWGSSKIFWTRERERGADGNWQQGTGYTYLGCIYNPAVVDENDNDLIKIKILLNGKKTVECVGYFKNNTNYIKLRDLQTVLKLAKVGYIAEKKLPTVDKIK